MPVVAVPMPSCAGSPYGMSLLSAPLPAQDSREKRWLRFGLAETGVGQFTPKVAGSSFE